MTAKEEKTAEKVVEEGKDGKQEKDKEAEEPKLVRNALAFPRTREPNLTS